MEVVNLKSHNNAILEACRVLKAGGVIAYPTEAVFGLGCDPWDEAAVARIFTIKNRDKSKGFIIVAANILQLEPFVADFPEAYKLQIFGSWPGPTTWVLPATSAFKKINRGADTIAVRVSKHPVVQDLCLKFGGGIISTSANFQGEAPLTTTKAVSAKLGKLVDYIVDAKVGDSLKPTTIINGITGEIIRP